MTKPFRFFFPKFIPYSLFHRITTYENSSQTFGAGIQGGSETNSCYPARALQAFARTLAVGRTTSDTSAGITGDTIAAWEALVLLTKQTYPHKHPAQAKTLDKDDMLAIVEERLAGNFTTAKLHRRITLLKHAFPSSPTRPPLLGLAFKHPDQDKFQHVAFAALYSAKKFLFTVLENTSYKWVSDDEIEVHEPHYFTITCDGIEAGLDTVFEYKPTKEEEAWDLPENYRQMARKIASARAPDIENVSVPTPEPAKRVLAKPQVKAPVSKPVAKPKPSAEGLITLAEHAAPYGFDAKQARAIMRSAGIDKPASGRWEWPENKEPKHIHDALKMAQKK